MVESNAAIDARGLTRTFPGVKAVTDLSFQVRYGEIFGLVGPDGAGKTTTMRMLAGVLAPDSGFATVAGSDVTKDPEAVKEHISYMSQRFGLYEDLTVDENIRFYGEIFGTKRKEREKRADELLRAADMQRFRTRLAGKLSGGMKQKLGLVCALIHTPKVILLDEPTNGVDPVSRRDFWQILYSLLGQGVAILTSTSYLDEAERCNRVALLHEGKLLFCDTPSELKSKFANSVVSIVSPDARNVRKAIASSAGVRNSVLAGDAVRLIVDEADKRIPELRDQLTAANISFEFVERVTPSVEDVFVSAVQGAEQ